ncbi:MAG: glutamine synthetase III [Xanthomonadaceae bacterium]|nr:glutamine synthetase III [Xanthomonadaceae bacterium]
MQTNYLTFRKEAIKESFSRTPRVFDHPKDEKGNPQKVSDYFGTHVFDVRKMKEKLPKDTFNRLMQTIRLGKKLENDIAATLAQTIKEWAMSKGVSHYCHWFQPQTGLTAEKHDAFLSFDEQKRPVEIFSASQLIQSEPDASSFPSGGMRATFEARGYTAWDPSSPIFIAEGAGTKTLCIPSVFISYTGDCLDEKGPLLQSIEVLSNKATELLTVMGERGALRVITTLGPEQEYFLIDRAFYAARPDLIMTGRTLLGGQPPKGQQLEDHYFGSIPERVKSFMAEFEMELYKLGVPVKTRHNEVAPSQFESAPIFEEAEVAVDHNQLTMETLKRIALRHGFQVLLHEKPFAGLNGTGKHCNWSMSIVSDTPDLDGTNLLNPGKTPRQNLRFLTFLVSVLKGVHKHAGLLRAGIASSGNDHRLGANEAPPAIISVFLGDLLNKILDEIASSSGPVKDAGEQMLKLGVAKLPEIMKDNTDRNRTSPFAFTGNKFEFRAVGGSANPAFPVMLLNAAVSDGVGDVTARIKAKISAGANLDDALLSTIKEVVTETKAVRFEGNNYSDDWVKEAAARGLPNLRKTPEALAQMITPSSMKLLTELDIFSEHELHSRFHVRVERYVKNLSIEVDTLKLMVDTSVLPAAYGYLGEIATTVKTMKEAGRSLIPQTEILGKLETLTDTLLKRRKELDSAYTKVEKTEDYVKKAELLAREVAPSMDEVRAVCDELEGNIADQYWPFPKYTEMLFIS